MISPYLFKFRPIFKEKIWGGQKIKSELNKDFSPLDNCGETWELYGVKGNISVVSEGPLVGTKLPDLIDTYKSELLGSKVYDKEKKHRLIMYCENNNFDPKDAYYYGDSYTDYHVMESVGNPVAVSPDKKLLKIAMANNWQILVKDR